jgi:hypothetical protein
MKIITISFISYFYNTTMKLLSMYNQCKQIAEKRTWILVEMERFFKKLELLCVFTFNESWVLPIAD